MLKNLPYPLFFKEGNSTRIPKHLHNKAPLFLLSYFPLKKGEKGGFDFFYSFGGRRGILSSRAYFRLLRGAVALEIVTNEMKI